MIFRNLGKLWRKISVESYTTLNGLICSQFNGVNERGSVIKQGGGGGTLLSGNMVTKEKYHG